MEVLLFGILGLFGVLGHTEIFGGDDADEQTPGTPDETGGDTLDTGASFVENADGSYDVELGDDETGSLAAIKFEQLSNGENFDQQFSLGLYLVPEGTEIPIDPTGEELQEFEDIDSMVESLGLTEIASFDQGTLTNPLDGSEQEDTRAEPPLINSDDPIDIIRLRYDVGDGGEYFIRSEPDETLSAFEEPGDYFDGTEAVQTTEDYTGTDAQDYVRAFGDDDTDPIAVDGGGGDDALFSNIAGSSLHGGDGEDLLVSIASGAQVSGGTGSDELIVGPNSMASGGAGNDHLTAVTAADGAYSYNGNVFDLSELPEDEGTELHGHAGDDYLTASAASVSAHGGADNDTLTLSNGATGYGGKGDDFFNVEAGVTAKGGDGDDRFQMVETASDAVEAGTAVLSGGAGADTYEFSLFNAFSSDEAQFIRIKDFDPEEDILTIDGWGDNTTLQTVRVEEAENGNYTNVIAVFTQPTPDDETATVLATIRLDGVSGYSASELVAAG